MWTVARTPQKGVGWGSCPGGAALLQREPLGRASQRVAERAGAGVGLRAAGKFAVDLADIMTPLGMRFSAAAEVSTASREVTAPSTVELEHGSANTAFSRAHRCDVCSGVKIDNLSVSICLPVRPRKRTYDLRVDVCTPWTRVGLCKHRLRPALRMASVA